MAADKTIGKKIRRSPLGRAMTESGFAVVFTFLPIMLLSIPFSERSGEISWSSFIEKFYKFWEGGQLALPILGVCGSVAALAALNGKGLPSFLNIIAWLVSVALFLACGFALAESAGFSETLNGGVLNAGVWAYIVILILWTLLSVVSHTDFDRKNPEERADKLVKDLRQGEGD
jgi:hypothetical protein